MAGLLTPPPENPSKAGNEREELVTRLDELLEQYLELLDQYMKAREQASSLFSAGYMSLAQANYHNRTRFGQDYYDERMQAIRYVSVKSKNDIPNFTISKPEQREVSAEEEAEKPKTSEKKSSPPTPSEDPTDTPILDEKHPNSTKPSSPKPVDPIRWFGILVPPALRSAQTSFVNAIEGTIPHLASLSKELRDMEIEIGRARKRIRKIDG